MNYQATGNRLRSKRYSVQFKHLFTAAQSNCSPATRWVVPKCSFSSPDRVLDWGWTKVETFQTTDGTSHRSEILSPSEWSYFRFIEEAVDSVNRKCYKLNHLARLKAVVLMTAGQESRVRFDNRG